MLKARKTLRTVGMVLAGLGILAIIGIVGRADYTAQGLSIGRSLVALGVAIVGLLLIIATDYDRL